VAACGGPRGVAKPPPSGSASHLSEVVGFWAAGNHISLAPASRYPHAVTVFSPLWYTLNPDGSLVDKVNATVAGEASRLHWPVVPIVNLAGPPSFLMSIAGRIVVARNLAGLVRQNHYQGINLDFEPAIAADRSDLAAFVIDLHDLLPKGGRDLYLDLVPASGGAYNYAAMTPEVTAYILMSYDEHDSGSFAGPVAGDGWVRARLKRILSVVPASKVDLGLALYGYQWAAGTTVATTLPANAVPPVVSAHATYDAADQEMTGTYTDAAGTKYVFWYETPEGLATKIKLAEAMHLRGLAVWRLGYQTGGDLALLSHALASGTAKPSPSTGLSSSSRNPAVTHP